MSKKSTAKNVAPGAAVERPDFSNVVTFKRRETKTYFDAERKRFERKVYAAPVADDTGLHMENASDLDDMEFKPRLEGMFAKIASHKITLDAAITDMLYFAIGVFHKTNCFRPINYAIRLLARLGDSGLTSKARNACRAFGFTFENGCATSCASRAQLPKLLEEYQGVLFTQWKNRKAAPGANKQELINKRAYTHDASKALKKMQKASAAKRSKLDERDLDSLSSSDLNALEMEKDYYSQKAAREDILLALSDMLGELKDVDLRQASPSDIAVYLKNHITANAK